jgi:hypothetical protein
MPTPFQEGRIPWHVVPAIDEFIQKAIIEKMLLEDAVLDRVRQLWEQKPPRPAPPGAPPAPSPDNECAETVAALHHISAQLAALTGVVGNTNTVIAQALGVIAHAQVLHCEYLHNLGDRLDDSNRIRLQQFPHRDFWVYSMSRFEDILTEGFLENARAQDEITNRSFGTTLPERTLSIGADEDIEVSEIVVNAEPAQEEYAA